MRIKVQILVVLFFVFEIDQVCHALTFKTFRCNNGKYIKDDFFCDGDRDCSRKEDEGSSCKRSFCGKGKFACDGTCKNITVRCNTKKECTDGTDELNCGDEINVKNCTSKGKFLCRDGLRCLDLDLTCNKDCNCFDCSEENSNCTKRDNQLLSQCPNAYIVGGNGPACLCDSSTDNQTSSLCSDIEACPRYHGCDQHCIQFKSGRYCTCYAGYHQLDELDGSKCRSDDWYENVIVYSTVLRIKSLNVTTNKTSVLQNRVSTCTALSAAHDYVYYATVLSDGKGKLFKAPLVPGSAKEITETDFNITSIAADYITGNVYFTSNGSLSVCSNEGRICKELKCCNKRYVAVAPKSGWLFYLESTITFSRTGMVVWRSNMDGSNETIFADDLYYGIEFSMSVDESKSKLYVLSTYSYTNKVKIDQISFDGEFKETVATSNLHSLAVLGGDLFVTNTDGNHILHTSKFRRLRSIDDDLDLYFRDANATSATYLFAYNAGLQKKNQNPCKSSCSGLCLIKSQVSSKSGLSSTCLCNGFTPIDDNHWCSDHPARATGHTTLWIIVCIILLIGLAGSGYYIFPKTNWGDYYLTLRRSVQNGRNGMNIINNEE